MSNRQEESPFDVLQRNCDEAINAGHELFERGDLAGAESKWRWALQLNCREPTALFNLGVVCEDTGRTREAMRWYRRALAVDPDFHDARHSLERFVGKGGK